jgi:predicted ribosome quality control (RQC) complex YloA/Tae2 family protein
MVYYFKARPELGDYTIYMGLDKFENEDLIKYGWPEDIWFHVDKLSSAHVYLRLHKGQTIESITPELLEDCAQLVKANSIQGSIPLQKSVFWCMHSWCSVWQGIIIVSFQSERKF